MNTREINALVKPAFIRLQFLDSKGATAYRWRCLAMAIDEERQHRKGAPVRQTYPRGAEVTATARLFVVKRIAEALTAQRKMTVADMLHRQPSAFYAAALVAEFEAQIRDAWADLDIEQLAALDYCEFIGSK